MANVLEVKGLNKSYPDFSLQNINFTLQEDCITGFIGVNGAGKTTTLRTILGLAGKTSGTIKFFGKDMEHHEQTARDRIGIVFDDGCFYEELTMQEMKSIIAPAYSKWDEKIYRGYMDKFTLNPKQVISTLSKGMKIKFALALALSHNADLLIMDEPTSGLDPLVRSQLLGILNEYMKQGGKAVFYSTHITSDLDKTADMLIMINGGRIVFEEEKDTLLDSYRVVKGNTSSLSPEITRLFLHIQKTDYGFTGIAQNTNEIKTHLPGIILERPTIEDIMLAHIEGGQL